MMNSKLILMILTVLLIILGIIGGLRVFDTTIFPKLIYKGLIEKSRNPKWITTISSNYYGLNDVDIVLCESKFHTLPYFRVDKVNEKERMELWIDNETSVDDAEEVVRLALCAKLRFKYDLWFPEKPIFWLSVLIYMLEGNDINMEEK